MFATSAHKPLLSVLVGCVKGVRGHYKVRPDGTRGDQSTSLFCPWSDQHQSTVDKTIGRYEVQFRSCR